MYTTKPMKPNDDKPVSKPNNMLIIALSAVILVLLVILAAGATYFLFLKPSSQPSPASVNTPATPGTAPRAAGESAPAAPAAAAYQTQGTLPGVSGQGTAPATVQVLEFRRVSGNMLMLRLALIADGGKDINNIFAQSALRETYLVDPAQQKKYEVMKDAIGNALIGGIGHQNIKAGERVVVFAQFPAPPTTTTRMNIYFGEFPPIMDVPITAADAQSSAASSAAVAPDMPQPPLPADGASGRVSEISGRITNTGGRISDLEGALRDLGARTVGNQIMVELPSDVLFDFDKYNIRADAAATLGKLLTIINAQAGDAPVRIEGHTDAIADDAYNQRLSERRAAAVKDWLAEHGVSAQRMQTYGYGESRPRAANTKPDGSDDPQGRQQNRRVEISITKG